MRPAEPLRAEHLRFSGFLSTFELEMQRISDSSDNIRYPILSDPLRSENESLCSLSALRSAPKIKKKSVSAIQSAPKS